MHDFKLDATAVVTGGSSGIGLATVELLLAQGARVALCGRNPERLEQAVKQLLERHPEAGTRLFAQACDVLDAEQVQQFASASEAALGPASILINNAGGSGPNSPVKMGGAELSAVLAWNVTPAYLLIQKTAQAMIQKNLIPLPLTLM